MFHIHIMIMETTHNNNVYLPTEAHRRAYYKLYNYHAQEIFKKLCVFALLLIYVNAFLYLSQCALENNGSPFQLTKQNIYYRCYLCL